MAITIETKTFLDEEGLNAYHSGNIAKINDSISSHNSSSTSHEDLRGEISDINEAILDLQSDSHTHNNKTILDNTTASFTTVLKNKLDSVEEGANLYVLPDANNQTKGGVIIGNNVQVSNGKISIQDGTTSQKGVVVLEDGVTSTSTSTAATPNSVKQAYDLANTANNAVGTHNVSVSAHEDIRILISELTNRLNALADSDDTTLDQLSEIVSYIKSNKSLIDDITVTKVNVSDIINNLTTNVNNKPLSAAQGVAIKLLIDTLQSEVDDHYNTLTDHMNNKNNPHNVTLNQLGITARAEEINFLSGTAYNVQEQLNGKTAVKIVRWS